MFGTSPFRIVLNGVDVRRFRFSGEARQRLREAILGPGGNEKTILIGVIARLEPVKNHSFIIHVVEEMRKSGISFRLALVGRGSQERMLRDLVERLGVIEYVNFLGVRDDVPDLLSAFDLVALPSLLEGFPVSAIEAQINGVPLVMSSRVDSDARLLENCLLLDIEGPEAPGNWAESFLEMAHGSATRLVVPQDVADRFDNGHIGPAIYDVYTGRL